MSFDATLDLLAARLRRETGLVLDDGRASALRGAVTRLGASGPGELLRRLDAPGGAELTERLVDEVTVNETFFFRHPEELVKIDWAARAATARARGHDEVRVWVAGCASGEEAYTLAMLALEALGPAAPVRILATDIAETALGEARLGRYGARRLRRVDAERRARWFDDCGGGELAVADTLRRVVDVRRHNLVRDAIPPIGETSFDVITCRNVLIYFARDDAQHAVARMRAALRPGGQLVLGAADRLGGIAATTSREPPAALVDERPAGSAAIAHRRRRPVGPRPVTRPADGSAPELDAALALAHGREALDRGAAPEAVRALRRALFLDPSSVEAAFELSSAHAAVGDDGAARRALWTALRVAEDQGDADPAFVEACRRRLEGAERGAA